MKKILLLCLLALVGCAAPDPKDIKTIQQVYAPRLKQLRIGCTLNDFQSEFPEATPGGQNGDITAYEIELVQVLRDRRRPIDRALGLYHGDDIENRQRLWFYFQDDKLAKWGRPQDWPQTPDFIMEKRLR